MLNQREFMALYKLGSNEEAGKYWSQYAVSGMMGYGSFSEGYRQAEPEVTEDQINKTWGSADKDGNGMLDLAEFMDMFEEGQKDAEA